MQKISKYQGLIISVSSAVLCLPFILILKLPLIITAAAVFIIVAGPQVYLLLFGAKKAETSTKKESSTDTSSLELKNSLERIALLEAELDRYKNREETACAEFFIMALKAYVFSPVLSELCDSISHNLSSTTEPLSEELLQIKKNISSFLAGVRQYDDEVKNHRMLQKVSEESDMLQSDMTTLDTNVRDVFSAIGTKVAQLKTVNDKIGEVAQNITEVSDKIRILSFNASIEAARAGKAGSGFRVIASEIKNLSANTDSHLELIWKTLKETQDIFESIKSGMDQNSESIYSVLSSRKEGLSSFITVMHRYFDDFDHLYTSVNSIISSLSASMDTISPVVQLHEITSQEIGNMKLVIEDFAGSVCDVYRTQPNSKSMDSDASKTDAAAQEIAKTVRKRLTTERELKAMERGLAKKAPGTRIDLGINTNAIELF